MALKCEICEGKKYILGFGGMKKDCPDCSKSKEPTKKVGRPKQNKE